MKVFVTGGTGFVGGEVLKQLLEAGRQVRALVRRGSEAKLKTREGVEIHHGDATEPRSLDGAMEGCQAVIHLVGIIREFPAKGVTFSRLHTEATRHVVEAAHDQGVRRYLHMSANGTRSGAATAYHQTKWQAEQIVRDSSLDWTIFRPSLIFGKGGDFVNTLGDMVRKFPVIPVIGDGKYRMSPVAVQDVARSFVKALQLESTIGQAYHCCGSQEMSYNEILDSFGQAVGKSRVPKLHHPVFLMKPVVKMFESIPQFPLTSTQLAMLLEGNVCDPKEWAETFGIEPISFAEEVKLCFD